MRRRLALLVLPLLAFCAVGCNEQSTHSAAAAATPGVDIPVGPIPGPRLSQSLTSDPYTGNDIALQEGWRLFNWYNCSGCHGGHGGGGMGPTLRDPKEWLYGSSDAQIFASIAEGRGKGMPAWGTKVPEEEIWKLVAYIKSLNTPQEPSPPRVPSAPKVKEAKG